MTKSILTKVGTIAMASTLLFTGGIGLAATADNGQSEIAHADSYANGVQTKTVHSMYGDVKLTVTYKYNITKDTSKITGIKSYSSSDSYLKLVDKDWDSSHATVTYYDKTHEVYVTNTIWASSLH